MFLSTLLLNTKAVIKATCIHYYQHQFFSKIYSPIVVHNLSSKCQWKILLCWHILCLILNNWSAHAHMYYIFIVIKIIIMELLVWIFLRMNILPKLIEDHFENPPNLKSCDWYEWLQLGLIILCLIDQVWIINIIKLEV